MNRFAVVLTHNRPELLAECVAAIGPQVDVLIVVDNASDPPMDLEDLTWHAVLVQVPDQPPNLAKLWNVGINLAGQMHGNDLADPAAPWHIAFLCDDAIAPPGWFDAVTAAMTATGAAAGCSNPWGNPHPPQLKTAPDSDLMGRMVGWAFIVNAAQGLRADESMHWWWCDTDMDWQARAAGGMVMVGGYPVPNQRPGEYTNTIPGLGAQAGRDAETFAAKHGSRPW
jgi:glycosyltransferase involved in cell wall biosynthesis